MMMPYRYRQILRAAWLAVLVVLVAALFVSLINVLLGWRGIVALLLVFLALTLLHRLLDRRLPRRCILKLDLESPVVEMLPENSLAAGAMFARATPVGDIVSALGRAASDSRVVAVSARLAPTGMSLAHAQEIRDAVLAVRRSGKTCVVTCPTLGEGRVGSVEYFLASAFERVAVQPLGDVGLVGVIAQQPFIRPLLDRLGIVPRLDHRRQYKSAANLFKESDFTQAHRESVEAVLQSHLDQMVAGIAEQRRLSAERVRELVDDGPFQAEAAREAGLIDEVAYPEAVEQSLKEALRARNVTMMQYLRVTGGLYSRGATMALIRGVGAVHPGSSRHRQAPLGMVMGAQDMVRAFRDAAKSKKVRAIVFRIDSPGGSAVASEAIHQAVREAGQAGKPVIVSMSSVAGSGGYYVAAPSRRIVSQPGTITGSIGVVTGKLVTREAWRRAGINWRTIQRGAHAGMWSWRQDFDDEGWSKLQTTLDHVYEVFKQRVAEGRSLSLDRVEQLARGRIWSGADAHERGLVDELGGMDRAVALAREAAGLKPDAPVKLVPFPGPRRLWSRLSRSEPTDSQLLMHEAGQWLGPVARLAADARQGQWMKMPELY